MSIGHKIRGMSQKELGIKSGFSAATADVRIRQYKSHKMIPKETKSNEIDTTLELDVSPLKDHDIYSNLDLMQILFKSEENHGLLMEKETNRYVSVI
ncbi:hypothetical protein [Acetobacterium wieringae]|nr:hypothetical protein [Acetobacterium wieringae]